MGDRPLVTVIVPVYNAGNYLVSCLNSIVNQTYRDLEILLINDGSTDNSEKICREYMSKDGRIQLFCQENRGQSAARNVGLDHMSGEYLIFVDADDYIELSCIEILLTKLTEYQVPIAVCGFDELKEEAAVQMTSYQDGVVSSQRVSQKQIYDSLRRWSTSADFIVVVGALYKGKLFKTLRFPVGKVCEDEFIFHQIYDQVECVCYVDLKLYHYIQTSSSTMRNNGVRRVHREGIEALLQRLEYFQTGGKKKYIQFTAYSILFLTKKFCQQSGMDHRQIRRCIREMIGEIKRITGRRICPFKIRLYILSPEIYGLLKRLYRIHHK